MLPLLFVIIVGGLFSLVTIWFLVVVFVGRFERRYTCRLVPLEDQQGPVSCSAAAAKVANAAIPLGFLYLGAFRDDESGILKVRQDLYFSTDGHVLLLIPSVIRSFGYRLISRAADGHWLLTGEVAGDSDPTGLILVSRLPGCTLEQVLRYHRDRTESYSAKLVPFDPETLIHDLYERDQLRAQRAIDGGMAHWVAGKEGNCFVLNWRGAFKMLGLLFRSFSDLKQSQLLAEHYKRLGNLDA